LERKGNSHSLFFVRNFSGVLNQTPWNFEHLYLRITVSLQRTEEHLLPIITNNKYVIIRVERITIIFYNLVLYQNKKNLRTFIAGQLELSNKDALGIL